MMTINKRVNPMKTPAITYLFFFRSQSISFSIRSDYVRSFCIWYSVDMVLFSNFSDCDRRLYLMSLATSSHSNAYYFASSRARLFCSSYRSYFEKPSSSSTSPLPWSILRSRSYCLSLYYFRIVSNLALCFAN